MNWFDSFVAFDTETTGLDSSARIVELGVVSFEDGVVAREWSSLLYPEGVDFNDPGVQKAFEVNQIDPRDLKDKPRFADVLLDFQLEMGADAWVAHNASFDVRMIEQELARAGKSARRPALLVCTRDLSAHFGHFPNKLSDVALRYGVTQPDAHRAVVDARVCGQVLLSMKRRGILPETQADMTALCAQAVNRGRRR